MGESEKRAEREQHSVQPLLAGAESATLFLDEDLRVRWSTFATGEEVTAVTFEHATPLAELALGTDDPHLIDDAHTVLVSQRPHERTVRGPDGRSFLRRVLPCRDERGRCEGVCLTFTDVTHLHEVLRSVEIRERQQAAVAALGRLALASKSLSSLLDDAVAAVARALGTELAAALELQPGGDDLLVRAGVGWDAGIVGRATVSAGLDSQAGHTLDCGCPIAVEDQAREHRFGLAPLLRAHGVTSGLSVVVDFPDSAWGVLAAHARAPRRFTQDDVHFLEAVANVIAETIRRADYESELQRRAHETNLLFRATTAASSSLEEALQFCVDAVCDVTGYPVGHAYALSPDGRQLVPSAVWHVDDEERTREFRRVTEQTRFRRGEGFVGAIWGKREPMSLRDVTAEPTFKRARAGSALPVRGAFGFPVIVDAEVAAVLEFFAYEPAAREDQPLEVVRSLGEHLGRAFERNRAAEWLRASTERLSLALEAGRLGAWEWDVVTGAMRWTELYLRMLGYEPGQVLPSYGAWIERVHQDDRTRLVGALRRARSQGPIHCECRIVHPDGTVRWVEVRGACSADEDGERRRMYGVLIDRTERLEMEARLREADRQKDAFLSTLGHELRNPLGALGSGVELLRKRCEDRCDLRGVTEMMGRQVRLMARLLDDLLDVGRIARGTVELERRRLRVADCFEQALETVRVLVEDKGHRVSVSIEPPDLTVVADAVRLEQVLVNLLSNAARYTIRPGLIAVDARADGDGVRLVVSDAGVGLAPDDVERIFEPFYQGRKGAGGLGIGLSIARKLVELHGGTLVARSEGLGLGSAFELALPEVFGFESEVVEPARDEEAADLGRLRLLVVDDHAPTLHVLEALLSDHCRVATAATGAEALEQARRTRPHVVLLDLALPDMSGFEVAAALTSDAEQERPELVAMTGFGDTETESRIERAGFGSCVLKPVDFPALLALLREAVERC